MLRSGLQKNKTLIYMATPSNDISNAIAGAKEKSQFSITDVLKDIDEVMIYLFILYSPTLEKWFHLWIFWV